MAVIHGDGMSQWTSILRRRGVLPILGTALIAIVGVGALGQTSQYAQSTVHDTDYPPPYDNSKADRRLKVFDEGHPKCALWTDWHKLCSRTGPNGSTYCRTDAWYQVSPSTPFCVRDFSQPRAVQAPSEIESQNRFSHIEKNLCGRASGGSCFAQPQRAWSKKRPFGGRYLGEMEHPSCVVWRTYNTDGSRQMCAEDGRSTLPSCKSAKFASHTQPYPFVCAEFSARHLCAEFQNNNSGEKINNLPGLQNYNVDVEISDGPLMRTKTEFRLNGHPAWGIYCPLP